LNAKEFSELSIRDSLLVIATTQQKITLLKNAVESRLYTAPYEAVMYAKMADSIALNSNSIHAKARSANLLGMANYTKGQYEESIKYYLQAIKLAESIDSIDFKIKVENNLAGTYQQIGNLDLAIKYYKEVYDYRYAANDSLWIAHCANNLSEQYMKKGELNKSDDYSQIAMKLYKALDLNQFLGIAVLNSGDLKVEQQKYDEGIGQYKRSMEIIPQNSNALVHACANEGIGSALITQKKYKEAIPYLKDGYQLAKTLEHKLQIIQSLEGLAKAYEKLGDSDQAVKTLKEYVMVKDSVNLVASDKRLKDAMQKYESEKKEKEIQLLTKSQEVAELKLSNSKKASYGLLVALGLSLIFLYSFFKFNNKIKEKNSIISSTLADREILLKEIHHRVKNNLQVISSLLSLQSRYTDDPSIESALQEGKNRVKSMSLIHQNLYQKGNLTGIDMQDYFTKLFKSLFSSYNIHQERIKLVLDLPKINLDVETVVPIGLIVNEMVSNSLKHAFPDGQDGVVSVSLVEQDNVISLIVSDNGVGIDDINDIFDGESFGYTLIDSFKDKLNADLSVDSENGTKISMKIKNYKKIA